MQEIKHFIGGREVDSLSGATFTKDNPATGEIFATVARGGAEDIDRAVEVAEQTFKSGVWSRLAPAERGKRLAKVAQLILDNLQSLAEAETRDSGKPLQDNLRIDVPFSADYWTFFAGAADKVQTMVVANEPGMHRYTLREPYGVVGCIAPWNFPIVMVTLKMAPALVAGNSIVFKMAEQTPTTVSMIAKLCLEAGIPEGVVNVVHGYGHEAGAALVKHPKVKKISFTGSTSVGTEIASVAGGQAKSALLEMGGKAANIIFADADLDLAVQGALQAGLANSGQFCLAASRLLVEEKIADEVLDRLREKFKTVRLGDPMNPATHLGPLVSKAQHERVLNYIEIGKQEGAKLLCGGKRPQLEAPFDKGYFIEPALFAEFKPQMRVSQEEIFGPVIGLMRFRTEAEAIEIANGTMYGLSNYFWTKDVDRVHRVSQALDSGLVFINMPQYSSPMMPSTGHKMSGVGEKLGLQGINAYTQLKSIYLNYSGKIFPWIS